MNVITYTVHLFDSDEPDAVPFLEASACTELEVIKYTLRAFEYRRLTRIVVTAVPPNNN